MLKILFVQFKRIYFCDLLFEDVAACIDFTGFEIPVPEKPVSNKHYSLFKMW
jgi:hypothetical protein